MPQPVQRTGLSAQRRFRYRARKIGGRPLSNTMAIVLGCLIVATLIADQVFNAGDATMFLLRKMFLLVEHLAFWR
jgi:hypothetical protein